MPFEPIEPIRELDYKTGIAIYNHVKELDNQLLAMAKQQELFLQEIASNRKAEHFDMLSAVEATSEKSGILFTKMLELTESRLTNHFDEVNRRLEMQEEKEQTNHFKIESIESQIRDLPTLRSNMKCLDDKVSDYNEISDFVKELQKTPGKKALAAWKWIAGVAGALGLTAANAYITWKITKVSGG
jgi:hypothetical protein